MTALAAEVRFSTHTGQKSSLSAAAFAADDWKDVPQGLKSLRENANVLKGTAFRPYV